MLQDRVNECCPTKLIWFVPIKFLQVDYSILDGPGAHLTNGIFLGNTVARETFVTQFVQDMSLAANISESRVLVLEIAPGRVHHDWEVQEEWNTSNLPVVDHDILVHVSCLQRPTETCVTFCPFSSPMRPCPLSSIFSTGTLLFAR